MPRRKRSSWGSNEPAGPSKRRIRFWADLHDGRGYVRHSKTVAGSRRDADEELARIRVAHSADAPVPTLAQAYETWWLPEAEDKVERGEMAQSTFSNYVSRWNRHVAPALGNVPVTDIRPAMVQEWLLGLTESMAGTSLLVLRQVLALCVRYEAADRNVAREDYRMPRRAERVHSKDVYTLAEMEAALAAVRGTAAYLPAVLCGVASCRVGESLGPRVDLGEVREAEACGMRLAVVDVVRNVDRNGRVGEDGALKNAQSVRPVVVPEPWSADVLAAGGPVFLADRGDGTPVSQGAANRVWAEALRAAGIEPIPMRNLRNSWRTIMRWELGVDEDKVERMMGHAGKNVGEIHYDRPREEVFAQTVAEAWVRYRAKA